MPHDEQLDICLEKWKQFDAHKAESVDVRDDVKANKAKIVLLEEQMKIVYPKVMNMPMQLFIAGFVGGLIGSMAGNGVMITVAKMFFKTISLN